MLKTISECRRSPCFSRSQSVKSARRTFVNNIRKSMPSCAFPKCKNTTKNRNKSSGITFHTFPSNVAIHKKWVENVRAARRDDEWTSNKYSRVCSDHFAPDEIFMTNNGLRKINKTAIPHSQIAVSAKTQKKKKTKKPQYDPFQEYANDSTDEESPEMKQENSDEAENSDAESEKSTPDTEKVFLKSIAYKEKQNLDGQPVSKRARLDTSEGQFNYTEELYEFGKFVAEQLMCLDVEDARIAQTEIREVLSKFNMNKIMRCLAEPSTSNAQPLSDEHCTQTLSQVNPDAFAKTQSRSKVNTARPSVSQSVFTHVNTSDPSATKSGSQVVAGPSRTQSGRKSTFTEISVVNVNPETSSMAPFGYVVVPPATDTGFNLTTQLGNREGPLVTQSGSETSVGSTVAVEPGSSSTIFCGTSVKTEPESESESSHDHVNVFLPSTETESVVIKYEPSSDGET